MGKEHAYQLAKHKPGHIYLGARSQSKAKDAIAEIKNDIPDAQITYLLLDLTSLESVKKASETLTSSCSRLDVLVNNAGTMACPAGQTKEGYEVQFGTNHVGHALLTKLLLPTMQKTAMEPGADVRIVNLTSMAHELAPKGGLALQDCKTDMSGHNTWTRYGQSKLANVHFTTELARRYPEIKSVAIHPGSVDTNLVSGPMASYPFVKVLFPLVRPLVTASVQTGALNQIWASTSVDGDVKSGALYYPVKKLVKGSSWAQNHEQAKQLWEWTEKQLADHGFPT